MNMKRIGTFKSFGENLPVYKVMKPLYMTMKELAEISESLPNLVDWRNPELGRKCLDKGQINSLFSDTISFDKYIAPMFDKDVKDLEKHYSDVELSTVDAGTGFTVVVYYYDDEIGTILSRDLARFKANIKISL